MEASHKYNEAGVDQQAADDLAGRLRSTSADVPGLLSGIGDFAASLAVPGGYDDPVVVATCDGVGTKTSLLKREGLLCTAGWDLVAACINDLVCKGAKPWFFMDYYGCGELDGDADKVLEGVLDCCDKAGCALVGGETAQLPGILGRGDLELVGFACGLAERGRLLGPHKVRDGDLLVGVWAAGLHCNGFSLVRKVLDDGLAAGMPEGLLAPVPLYSNAVLGLLGAGVGIHAAAHITGGGIAGCLARALPGNLGARVDNGSWQMTPVHDWLAKSAGLDDAELRRSTNCGLGFVLIVDADDSDRALGLLGKSGHRASVVGRVTGGSGVEFA